MTFLDELPVYDRTEAARETLIAEGLLVSNVNERSRQNFEQEFQSFRCHNSGETIFSDRRSSGSVPSARLRIALLGD